MKTRQFWLTPLLSQLQAQDEKIMLSDEELNESLEEQLHIKEKKQQQLLADIQTKIKTHGGSRIFELPDEVDCIYVDAKADSKKLLNLLLKTPENEINIEEGIPRFTSDSQTRPAIEAWAKMMMNHAANELLTANNDIQPELKTLWKNAPGTLTAADVILSFFTYNSMHISKLLEAYRHLDNIN